MHGSGADDAASRGNSIFRKLMLSVYYQFVWVWSGAASSCMCFEGRSARHAELACREEERSAQIILHHPVE